MKSVKFLHKYFSENLWYAKLVYILGGMGVGVLITYPFVGEHPMRWGLILLGLSALLHLYPLFTKKK